MRRDLFQIIKHNSFFYLVFLPILVVSSIIFPPSSIAVLVIGNFYFLQKDRYELVIITFILVIALGDNLWPQFEYYGILRIIDLILISFFSLIIVFRYDKGLDKRILIFLPFFLVSLFSSYVFSPAFTSSVARSISYFLLVFSIFTYFRYVFDERGQILYENVVIIISLIFMISLLGIVSPYHDLFFLNNRLRGLLGNPNSMALFSIFSYPIIDTFHYSNSEITEKQIGWIKIIIVGSVILTGSRNGLVSIFIYYLLKNYYTRGVTGKVYSLLAGVIIIIILFNLDVIMQYTPLREYFRAKSLDTASGRTIVWNVAIDQIKENPWLGRGDYFYQIFFQNFKSVHNLIGRYWNSVWNSYLAFLMDTGIIGLIAYFFFLAGLTKITNNIRVVIPFLAVALFSAIFESWMVSSLNAFTSLFLFYFIIVYNENTEKAI